MRIKNAHRNRRKRGVFFFLKVFWKLGCCTTCQKPWIYSIWSLLTNETTKQTDGLPQKCPRIFISWFKRTFGHIIFIYLLSKSLRNLRNAIFCFIGYYSWLISNSWFMLRMKTKLTRISSGWPNTLVHKFKIRYVLARRQLSWLVKSYFKVKFYVLR